MGRLNRSLSGRVEVLPTPFKDYLFVLEGGEVLNKYGRKEWHRYSVPSGGVYNVSVHCFQSDRLHMTFRSNELQYCFCIPVVGNKDKKGEIVHISTVYLREVRTA